jgi:hypothetical protein
MKPDLLTRLVDFDREAEQYLIAACQLFAASSVEDHESPRALPRWARSFLIDALVMVDARLHGET